MPKHVDKIFVVCARIASGQIIDQVSGEDPVAVGKVQGGGEEAQNVPAILSAEHGDPQSRREQKEWRPAAD